MNIVVDMADYKVSGDPEAELITYALGSCIGLTIWDPVARVGGMIHYMLPESTISPEKAERSPAMFADTGIPKLFKSAYELGAVKQRMIIKVAGGSSLLDDNGSFNIGKRNYTILRKLFWKNNLLVEAEDIGGTRSRTLRLNIANGQVTVKHRTEETEL